MKSRHLTRKAEEIKTPASQFDEIAFLYDELMVGVPYRYWADYLKHILKRHECSPSTVLDLCCGTGGVALQLAEMGCKVSGVDISQEMITLAKKKAEARGLQVDYHVQDVSSLNLRRRFDLAVSLFDSLNYILESAMLQQAFHRVSAHLQPGGLFIFDMNTELALAAGYFNQCNRGSRSRVIYDWRSTYDRIARICSISMKFDYRRRGYEKQIEIVHYQKAYDEEEITAMLRTAGLGVLAIYDAYTFEPAANQSDRVFFIARK